MTKNKKILIVTECFYPEEFKINDIALSWKNKGYDIDVLTLVPTYPFGKVFSNFKNTFFRKENYQDINIFRVYAITGYRDSAFKKKMKYLNFMILGSIIAILKGRKYDYIFGFNLGALTDMLPVVLIKKLYKKRTTLWVQDIWPDSLYAYGFKKNKILHNILNIFVKFIYRNIDAIAISSKGFETKLAHYTKKDINFHYLPNWSDNLDISSLAEKVDETNKVVNFTFAGNIGKLQNLENIISAYSSLSDECQKKSQLSIVGDGSNLAKLKILAKNNSNIIFYGRQPSSKMSEYYNNSDFLIVSLINDPLFSALIPSKTQTYIAAKKPILAIINGETANIVKDNNLGLYADPSNIKDISKLFKKCIEMNKEERENFINRNDYLLQTVFNKEKIIESLLKLVTSKI